MISLKIKDKLILDSKGRDLIIRKDKNNALEISRNPINGLPLFYTNYKGRLYISQDISFFIKSNIPLELNKNMLKSVLSTGHSISPQTLYKNIYRLPLLKKIIIKSGKNISFKIKEGLTWKKSISSEEEVTFSVRKILASELNKLKENTLFFSGGLDSSVLCSILKQNNSKFNMFSTGFEFETEDTLEKEYSISASNALGKKTKYQTFSLDSMLLLLPEMILKSGEPIGHIQTLLLYSLYIKNNKSMHKTILNGQCADAIFGTSHQYDFYNSSNFNKLKIRKDFIDNLRNDTDITMNCWALCLDGKAIFPFIHPEICSKMIELDWSVKLKEPKRILRQVGRIQKIPECIITRKKGNFGPISSRWGLKLKSILPICRTYFSESEINRDFKDEERYLIWNMINYSIWRKIFLDKISVKEVSKEISELLFT